ncbi:hypothetical protein H0H92_010631, partial [Tricholoma furcatifolium]
MPDNQERRKHILQYATFVLNIILTAVTNLFQSVYGSEPYHTSAVSGEAWVAELLSGHPKCIRTELGVPIE